MKLKDENEYRYDMDSHIKDARIHIRKTSQTSNQKDTMTMRTPSYIILDISLNSATNKEDKYCTTAMVQYLSICSLRSLHCVARELHDEAQ